MYLADMAEISKAGIGLPKGLLRKLTDEEIARFKKFSDKRAYKRERLLELMKLHDKVKADLESYEAKLASLKHFSLRSQVKEILERAKRDLANMKRIVDSLAARREKSMDGLGAGWEATGVALMENPGTAFLLPISIAIAIGLGIAVIKGREEVAKLFPAFGEAAKIAMTIVGISAAFLGIVWVIRIGTDLAAGDKKKKAEEPEGRRSLRPIAPSHGP